MNQFGSVTMVPVKALRSETEWFIICTRTHAHVHVNSTDLFDRNPTAGALATLYSFAHWAYKSEAL